MAGFEPDADQEDEDEPSTEEFDWQSEVAEAMKDGNRISGLPRGLRIRSSTLHKTSLTDEEAPSKSWSKLKALQTRSRGFSMIDYCLLLAFVIAGVLVTCHFVYRKLIPLAMPADNWRQGCRQCQRGWWHEFWEWRLAGSQGRSHAESQDPPEGMEWEWSSTSNNTDWYGASAEIVDAVVRTYADPGLGPVLQIGCGDSPIPELLVRAGFNRSEHLDIIPEVVKTMQQRYPASEWPGLSFKVRDFLERGAPPPLGRFSAVLDKAGIWDWLSEEAPHALPRLVEAVRLALVPPPQQGVYIIGTKQTPAELSQTLAKAFQDGGCPFHVEATRPLGSSGVAWAYVLSQV